MKGLFLKILYILGNGSIVYIFSERYFWGFWRPTIDTTQGIFLGVIFYSLMAYAVLYCIDYFKVQNKRNLILIALLYAYLAEAVISCELWTDRGLLVIFIAIPWHAIISIMFGWYFLLRFLNTASIIKKIISFLLVGILYAFWAITWRSLPGGDLLSLKNFIIHTTVVTILLIAVYRLTIVLKNTTAFRFTKKEGVLLFIFLCTLHVLLLTTSNRTSLLIYTVPINLTVISFLLYLIKRKAALQTKNTSVLFPENIKSSSEILLAVISSSIVMTLLFILNIRMPTYIIVGVLLFSATLYYSFCIFKNNTPTPGQTT